jgi:hypothetical protein
LLNSNRMIIFNKLKIYPMKKIAIIFLAIFVFSSCGKEKQETNSTTSSTPETETKQNTTPPVEKTAINSYTLLGRWVSGEYNMGFELKSGGKAASINMATLDYNWWKLEGDKLILNSTSKGVSNPVTVDEVFIIRNIAPDKIIVSPSQNPDTKWTYIKK